LLSWAGMMKTTLGACATVLGRIGLGMVAMVAIASGRNARAAELVAGGDLGLMHSTAVTGDGSASLIPFFAGTIGLSAGPFEAGARVGVAHDLLFGRTETVLGPYVGVQTRGSGPTAGLFLDGGVHTVSDIGDGLLKDATSEAANLPFVGARARFGLTIRRRFGAMVSVFVQRDLKTTAVSVSSMDCSVLDGCDGPTVTRYEVGGTTIGASLSFTFRNLSRAEREVSEPRDESEPMLNPASERTSDQRHDARPDLLDRGLPR
jgi:hypothetical protein